MTRDDESLAPTMKSEPHGFGIFGCDGHVINHKPLTYIAGPYTHPDPVINVRRAVEVAESIADVATPVVPHLTMLWHLISPHPVDWWYDRDIELLTRCDAVWRFSGASTGADREVDRAVRLGITVFSTEWSDFEESESTFIRPVSEFHNWALAWTP